MARMVESGIYENQEIIDYNHHQNRIINENQKCKAPLEDNSRCLSVFYDDDVYANQDMIANHLQSTNENQNCNVNNTHQTLQEHDLCKANSSVFYDNGIHSSNENPKKAVKNENGKLIYTRQKQEYDSSVFYDCENTIQSSHKNPDMTVKNQNGNLIYTRGKQENNSCSSVSSVFYDTDEGIHNRLTLLSGISGSCICESISSYSDSESGICSILGRLPYTCHRNRSKLT